MFYTVGEMAKILNTTPSTLRYYDKEGLLPFVERSESGIRMSLKTLKNLYIWSWKAMQPLKNALK